MANFTIAQSYVDYIEHLPYTFYIGGVLTPFVAGTVVPEGDEMKFILGSGYAFYDIDTARNETSMSLRGRLAHNMYIVNQYATLSDDFKTATVTPSSSYDRYYGINLQANQTEAENTISSNRVYKIDSDILEQVNSERFVMKNPGTLQTVVDYGTYIISVLLLPFKISVDQLLDPEKISLGDLKLKAEGVLVSTDSILLDLGTIEVPEKVGNSYDWVGTTCRLYLPNMDSIDLDLEVVLGQTLSIRYNVDCYTGLATLNLISTLTNEVIISKQIQYGYKVPYASVRVSTGTTSANMSVDVSGNNNIFTPFIEMIQFPVSNIDSKFTIGVTDDSLLSDATGYIEVDNITLETSAYSDESEQIISLLRGGVLIK